MGELANCPMCGELFLKEILTVCRSCYEKEEEQFETVYKYIRKKKNRTATVDEVAEATGVKESLIRKWVKERRIHRADFPNLTYSCERCGEQTTKESCVILVRMSFIMICKRATNQRLLIKSKKKKRTISIIM